MGAEQNNNYADRRAENEEKGAQIDRRFQQRIQSSQEIAGAIMDPRLKNMEYALPEVIGFLLPMTEEVSSISDYEASPIETALLLKAVGGQIEQVQGIQVIELEKEIAEKLRNPDLINVLGKIDGYELYIDDIPPVLTEDEDVLLMEYNELVGERGWILGRMTDGLSLLCENESRITMRLTHIERRRERVMSDFGRLNEDEIDLYEELITVQLDNLNGQELKDYQKLRDKHELSPKEEALWSRLMQKMKRDIPEEDIDLLRPLLEKTNFASLEDLKFYKKADKAVVNLKSQRENLSKQIEKKMAGLKEVNGDWMTLYKAFKGMVDNINVTDQWTKAWHDLGAGAIDGFTQTRWAEFQKPSDLVALMDLPGIGEAFQIAFSAMCKIGLNRTNEVPGSENVMQMGDKTRAQVDDGLIYPVRKYVSGELGGKVPDLYVNFGVEMARMLMENSFVAGWLCVGRETNGLIIYSRNNLVSSDFSSEAYKYGVPEHFGNGSVYADRDPDYKKIAAIRAKLLSDYGKGYETGLPAMIPVLPDNLAQAWIKHEDIVAIADRPERLREVFASMTENSRWPSFAHPIYRSAQIYEMVSKLFVGLKGLKSVQEETEFAFTALSNLGSMKKKINFAFGDDNHEKRRFCMNLFMSTLYAIDDVFSNQEAERELKTIVPGIDSSSKKTLFRFDKDDYKRSFVRSGFMSKEDFEFAWKRLGGILPGKGGEFGKGMIKRGETLPRVMAGTNRSEELIDQV